jgi:hypothetical protein
MCCSLSSLNHFVKIEEVETLTIEVEKLSRCEETYRIIHDVDDVAYPFHLYHQ